MPTTTAKRPKPDMTAVWAGRDQAAAQRRLDKAVTECLAQGFERVILIRPDGSTISYNRA